MMMRRQDSEPLVQAARTRLRSLVKSRVAERGWELRRLWATPGQRRVAVLERMGIDTVIDVGASRGQYASALRERGYGGHIWSFEPIPEAFNQLESAARDDPRWHVRNVAVGASEGHVEFNVSEDSVCSSVLPPTENMVQSLPGATAAQVIRVPQIRLDDVDFQSERMMLKIDTQGYENHVLDGAPELLKRIAAVDIEMALVELYAGGSTIYDLLPRLRDAGFSALSVEGGFVDPSSLQTLDVDVLMVRDEAPEAQNRSTQA